MQKQRWAVKEGQRKEQIGTIKMQTVLGSKNAVKEQIDGGISKKQTDGGKMSCTGVNWWRNEKGFKRANGWRNKEVLYKSKWDRWRGISALKIRIDWGMKMVCTEKRQMDGGTKMGCTGATIAENNNRKGFAKCYDYSCPERSWNAEKGRHCRFVLVSMGITF